VSMRRKLCHIIELPIFEYVFHQALLLAGAPCGVSRQTGEVVAVKKMNLERVSMTLVRCRNAVQAAHWASVLSILTPGMLLAG